MWLFIYEDRFGSASDLFRFGYEFVCVMIR